MRIGIVSPRREACGISDYTEGLSRALGKLVEVAYHVDPAGFRPEMNEVDLVHVQHEYFVFGGVAPWKSRFGRFISQVKRPVVMTVHEVVEPEGNPAFQAAVRLSNRLHFANPSIRRRIVHTALDRDRLARVIGESRKVEVIRLGVPESAALPDSAESKRELDLTNRFVLTIFGFIARKKGHLAALEAMELLPDNIALIIAGGKHPDDSTSYVDEVTKIARGLGVRARITGYLPMNQIPRYMAATDLALIPFTESSGSASLAQCFACGLPVLASDIPPHREIIRDTPESLRLTALQPAAIAQTILALRTDAVMLAQLRSGSVKYAKAHSMDNAAIETVRVYEEVLAEIGR